MSNDDLTAAVRDALDPTPASEADWPVSRRDTLRALAGVGALAVGPGGAQGAAGTGIADAAYFSNYGWESTAEGGVLTIDGAEFTFDGSETVVLDDGREASTVVLDDGATASTVVGPDGSVLKESAIPDSGTYYGFENEPADSGLPDGWEAVQSPDGQEVTTADSYAGSQSYRSYFTGSGTAIIHPSTQPYSEYYTDIKASVWVKQIDTSAGTDLAGLQLLEDGAVIAYPRMQNGDLVHYDASNTVTISTTPNAGEWVRILVTAVYPDTDTFDVSWQTATDSGSKSGLTCLSPVTNGWNTFALLTYGGSSGHYYDEYEIFS